MHANILETANEIHDYVTLVEIIDYALSQSTLEQVFLKQIRPSTEQEPGSVDVREASIASAAKNISKKPNWLDYFNGYTIWLISALLPGLHQFYLGDTWRGVKYFFTANELWVGWMLDLFEMHVLIQKRVEQYGNSRACFCFSCCYTVQDSSAPIGRESHQGTQMTPSPTVSRDNSNDRVLNENSANPMLSTGGNSIDRTF